MTREAMDKEQSLARQTLEAWITLKSQTCQNNPKNIYNPAHICVRRVFMFNLTT